MRFQLTKGPTISPALIGSPNPVTGAVDVIGFSGMTELDYVATHLAAALLARPEATNEGFPACIDTAVYLAKQLLSVSAETAQPRASQQRDAQQAIIPE